MSEEAKPRKVLSLKKKVTEESPPATSSSRPTWGLNRSRPASSWSPPVSKPFRAPQPARPVKNELILVTNNSNHFQRIPHLKLENWMKN